MTRAVKAVSTYRGRDPRDFVLCGFGGNGPVVAVAIARELQMRRVLVPLAPGVFSAAGLLLSEIEHEILQTLPARGEKASPRCWTPPTASSRPRPSARCDAEGVAGGAIALSRFADIRYAGQAYELTLPVAAGRPTSAGSRRTSAPSTTGRTGTRSTEAPIDIVNVKLTARAAGNGDAPYDPLAGLGARPASDAPRVLRARARLARCPGPLSRCAPRRAAREGPLIIEEYDATCVVPPGCPVTLDALGNIDIALG